MTKRYFQLILFFCFQFGSVIHALYDDGIFIYDRNRDYQDLALILKNNRQDLDENNLAIEFNYDDQGLVQESYMIKVARNKSKVVGAIFYSIKSVDVSYSWEILLLIVDKACRNQGYGSLLVQSVIADMIALQKNAMVVKISAMNKSAYHLFNNKCDFLELKWVSNPFRKNEYIEFLRLSHVSPEDYGELELSMQEIVNKKLWNACKNFDCKQAQDAISEGANFYLRLDFDGDDDSWKSRSPLYFAIEQNNIEFTRALIEAGVDITGVYETVAPLAFAMHLDFVDSDMILLLIQAGCDVNAVDDYDHSLLSLVFYNDDLVIAKALIDAGANIYVPGYWADSLLEDAIAKDDPDFLRLLLEAGYDVNRQDDGGFAGLHRAISYICDDAVFKLLLSADADMYQVDGQGRTPLDFLDSMLQEYQSRSFDHYRFRAEVEQLKKIKDILLQW